MKAFLEMEFHRAFRSAGFRLSVLCGIIIAGIDFVTFFSTYKLLADEKVVAQAWIGLDYQFAYNSLFFLLAPLFATFAYAGSYFEDMRSGYIKNLMIKVSRKEYFFTKYLVSFVSGAIVVAIPLIINLMVCMSFFSLRIPEKLRGLHGGANVDAKCLSELFYSNTFYYCLVFILIDMIYAGCIAVFSICIADFTDNLFSTVTIPFAVVTLSSVILSDLECFEKTNSNLSIMVIINPMQVSITTGLTMILMPVCMSFVSILWIFLKQRNKDIV